VAADNLSRAGSELNRSALRKLGVRFQHADLRASSDVESLPAVDWVIDAAALPSVLGGVDGRAASRQVVEHNLATVVNLLEFCRHHNAGLIILSTSRVYSIEALRNLPVHRAGRRFELTSTATLPPGVSPAGIAEEFPTSAPISLYGATKLASEVLALEYASSFGFPVWINRCGVMAGGGQFGRADQGIFSFWLNSWLRRQPLTYLGFDGDGHQVRDCLHPRDLVPLLVRQMRAVETVQPRLTNVSGGIASAMSLRELSDWCADRWGARDVAAEPRTRTFDVPWLVLDSATAHRDWVWRPETPVAAILEEIALHAETNPDWLELST
jgi:CDP-paratose 2-epimerase